MSVHILASVFQLTTLLFPSNCQHLDESDKLLVSFALTVKTAMLANGLWAITNTNVTVGVKKFREVSSRDRSLAYAKIFI